MKKTPLVNAVLNLLKKNPKPLSVPEILEKLATENLNPNKTTLYRMLEKLSNERKIEQLLIDPKITYYELTTHHHHHFTCQQCESIQCLEDNEIEKNIHQLEAELQKKGLLVRSHQFSLSGLCKNCSA